MTLYPALGIIEVQSIARGVVVADAMAKKAPVRILQNHTLSPGKHVVIVAGEVAEVDESMKAGLEVAAQTLIDRLFLPQAHAQLAPLLARRPEEPTPAAELDSVAVFETTTVCSAVLAADAAAKAADVVLIDLRLGQHLGGKGYFTMSGSLESIQAAAEAGQGVLEASLVVGVEIIPAPHDDLKPRLMW